MSKMNIVIPRQPVPPLEVATVAGATWRLADQLPEQFTLVVFYRGLHCPICSRYLKELEDKLPEFEKRGVNAFAVSMDPQDRAQAAQERWQLDRLPLGYGLSRTQAREWGLYLSTGRGVTSIGIEEPAVFSEPGLFLVRRDGTLYFSSIQTMPFARIHFDDVLQALDVVAARQYPARGEVVD